MITLYNLPTKTIPGIMITWQTRYALNLKNLPFQVVDIEALTKKISTAPTSTKPDGVSPFYTIPIIQDDSTGAVISDSIIIMVYLDETYPSSGPVLIPTRTKALQLALSSAVIDAFTPFQPFFSHSITKKMNDAMAAYFMRVKLGGVAKVDAPEGKERAKMWANMKESLGKMNKWFEGSESDFVMGNEPSFADT
ncbi:hypothetical protein ARMGADRAFT_1111000 [Armillaria gallica]|uniref:GST N-terminal domain-containing protein n=1 Tax=Armillaria gallica TaxID=47427 RepID=A0A2H3DPQ9_ARMGA|nr:hypothetical protein ARMGADRAFT_1111000 [Armillaria gallica]